MQQVPHSRYAESRTGHRETSAADEFAGYTVAVVGLAALVFAPGILLGAMLGAGAVTLSHRLRDSDVTLAGFVRREKTATSGATGACP